MALRTPQRLLTKDDDTNAALDDIRRCFEQLLQNQPWLAAAGFTGIALEDGVTKKLKHGLGRRYREVYLTPPKGPASTGRIEELTADDPTKEVWLQANGYGATVTVNVRVI